jgi:uracil-DNA glycosylase
VLRAHLEPVLSLSPAKALIALGNSARQRIQGAECGSFPQIEVREIGGLTRHIAYLPHPASFERGPRTLSGLYPRELPRLREIANR